MTDKSRNENREAFVMENMDGKKGAEATDDIPLKAENVDVAVAIEAKEKDGAAGSGNEVRVKGFRSWLSKPRVMWWIAVLVAILLITVVLIVTLLAMEDSSETYQNITPRLMMVHPRPKGRYQLIRFRHGSLPHEGADWPNLVNELSRLMSNYDAKHNVKRNRTECFGQLPPEGYACLFDISQISPDCRVSNFFGYRDGSPCIFLQFPNITGWEPQPYSTRDLELTRYLPKELRHGYNPAFAFIDCQGDTDVDKENMGPVLFMPEQGFPVNFFPYTGHPDYMPPLVVIRFRQPKVGVTISITCKLWAKNVSHQYDTALSGVTRLSLLIE
ncbi:sodium/potassium-transporting ATPase subunit beta-like [Tachypleus tridentatus]|uniref:sodium/potassium-transporting ATPase subunit beta-like n=1 Tax=Tachypleus tridentatus TaxID=6853 RepID=UPI003FD25BBA